MTLVSSPLPPVSTIGILGGGQLGRMLAQAASRIGFRTVILCPENHCPAADCASSHIVAGYDDEAALKDLANRADVITYEFENVPVQTAEMLTSMGALVAPGAKALEVAQDRLVEKDFIRSIGAQTAPYFAVDDIASLETGLRKIGAPAILKTRRLGYDGKGQTRIDALDQPLSDTWETAKQKAWDEIGAQPSILEGFVDFVCEISVIGARTRTGAIKLYDPARNDHAGGILRQSNVPSGAAAKAIRLATDITAQMLEALDYVGVIGVEFFVLADETVIVNEFAPRVHNSGHWTEAACACSQFEQHIRAICGWPLGNPARHSNAVMTNLLGSDVDGWPDYASTENTMLNLYGKSETRDGRKMGHVTRLSPLSQ